LADHREIKTKLLPLRKEMTDRVAPPSNLTGARLTRSGDGLSINPARTASVPESSIAARTLGPSHVERSVLSPAIIPSPLITTAAYDAAPVMAAPVMLAENGQMSGHTHHDGEVKTVVKDASWGIKFNPLSLIWMTLVFIIVYMILLSTKMNMVTCLEEGQRVIHTGKLLTWTVIIGIVISVLAIVLFNAATRSRNMTAVTTA